MDSKLVFLKLARKEQGQGLIFVNAQDIKVFNEDKRDGTVNVMISGAGTFNIDSSMEKFIDKLKDIGAKIVETYP